MSDALDHRRKKILYRASYRGFKEADIVIGGFARAHLDELTEAELDAFEALLVENDRDIYAWIMGDAPAPAAHDGPLLRRMQAFRPPVA